MRYDILTINNAVEMYEEGMLAREISDATGIKESTIRSWVQKYGNPRHRGPKSMIKKENYFDVIDNEFKAYFLGWIMADGCIAIKNGQYSIKLHVQLKDREIIDGFLLHIQSSNKTLIKNNDNNPSYYVSLTSRHMCESLMKLGVVPRKSGKEIIPSISQELIPHFICGREHS